jgi:hypothetical protein
VSDNSASNWARTDWDNTNVAGTGIIYQNQTGQFTIRNDAAAPITFERSGTESMRIDASGNVGIGTSSPATRLDVSGAITTRGTVPEIVYVESDTGTTFRTLVDGSAWDVRRNDYASLFSIQNATGNTLLCPTDGNVGIGTSSPGAKLAVSDGTVQIGLGPFAGVGYVGIVSNHPLGLFVNNVERARITADGLFVAGRTTSLNGHTFQAAGGADTYRTTTTAGAGVHHFYSDVGGFSLKAIVQADGSYTNLSDGRFKTDITPARSYLKDLMSVEVVTYRWKGSDNGAKRLGVIAQQVEQVFPSLVKEVVSNPDTGETQKMLPNEAFIPMLITAVQELTTKLEAAEARIATLEAR